MHRFTTILWDLDQTILDFNKSMHYALHDSFEKLNLEIDEEKIALYEKINNGYWECMERGEITKEEVLIGRFRTFFERIGITERKPEEIADIYQDALGSVFFFRDESDKLIIRLKEEGYRQYIVTNGVNRTQEKKIRLSGLDKMVDGVFVSELMGYPKPRIEFFDACFDRMKGITKNECILVGDSITSDMKGGVDAGITTCWYNPQKRPNTLGLSVDYEISNLWALPTILQE